MTMITPSYLGETIEYSSLHACRSTLEDPTKVYCAALKITDKEGHVFEDHSIHFSDPIAGNNTVGSPSYPNSGMTQIGAIAGPPGDYGYQCSAIDTANGYAYFGTYFNPARIVKVALGTGTATPVRVGFVTLNAGENSAQCAVIDTANGYAYFGTGGTSTGTIVKVALGAGDAPPTRVGAVTLNSGEVRLYSAVIDSANGYAYFGTNTSPGIVVKVALGAGNSPPSRVGALTFNSGENGLISGVIDAANGYAYFGCYAQTGIVVMVALGAGAALPTRVGALTLKSGENSIYSAQIDLPNRNAYFVSISGTVVKVALGTPGSLPVETGSVTIPYDGSVACSGIDPINGNLFFVTNSSGADLYKIILGTGNNPPAIAGICALPNAGAGLGVCASIDPSHGYAYFGTIPGGNYIPKVLKVSLNAGPIEVNSLALNAGETTPKCAVFDSVNGYAYFGTDTSPGIVVKVALGNGITPPTRIGSVTLNTGENHLTSAAIDPVNGYAYFGTNTSPGIVVKVALGTGNTAPARVGAVTLNSGENLLTSAVLDGSQEYLYFGTHTNPGIVVRVAAGAGAAVPARVDSISFNSQEPYADCAVIDPTQGYAYFGTNSNIGSIIKIALGTQTTPPMRVGSLLLSSLFNTNLTCAAIDAANGYAYFGTSNSSPQYVLKIALEQGPTSPSLTGTLAAAANQSSLGAVAIDTAGGFAYFATADGGVLKVLLGAGSAAPEESGYATFPQSLGFARYNTIIDPANGFVYAATDNDVNPSNIVQFTLTGNVAYVTAMSGPFEANPFSCAAIDTANGYAYFGTDTSPGIVVKIALGVGNALPTRIGSLTLNPGENELYAAVLDSANGYAYFGTLTGPGIVVKVALGAGDTLPTRVAALTLNTGEVYAESAVIDAANGYAYYGTSGGIVVKISLGTGNAPPARVAALDLSSDGTALQCAAIDTVNSFAYFGSNSNSGKIIKIALGAGNAAPTRIGALTVNTATNCAVLDVNNGFGFFGSSSSVLKIALGAGAAPPTLIGSAGSIGLAYSGVIDPANGNAYFGASASPSKVTKVTLGTGSSPPAKVGTLTIQENYVHCAVIDAANGFAYFGADDSPGPVVKVALSQKGAVIATQMVLTESAQVTDLRFYSHAASGNLRLAIYDNNSPKNLLWQSNATVNSGGEIAIPIAAGTPGSLAIGAGTYWLAWQTDSTAAIGSYAAGTAGSGFVVNQGFGTYPASLSSALITSTSDTWTEYITYQQVPVQVNPPTLPSATLNQAGYSQTITASGGAGTLTLSHTGTIPPGMAFDDATGILNGTPTALGTYTFTVMATDSGGATASTTYTLPVIQAAPGSFKTIAPMVAQRTQHTASLLPNGKLLIAGGTTGIGGLALKTAELYDPTLNAWTSAGNMTTARNSHTATLLRNGKVLITGGTNGSGDLATCELYDPASNTWSSAASMATSRQVHTATLLANGKVLVVGGSGGNIITILNSAEIYDPVTNHWTTMASLTTARYLHTATLLPNGKVLVAAGYNGGSPTYPANAELYDPASNTWVPAGNIYNPRYEHVATLLPNGKVIIVGGQGSSAYTRTETYDPATNSWTLTANLSTVRIHCTTTLLPNGKLAAIGGAVTFNGTGLVSTEIYDPATDIWTLAATMATGRSYHTASLMPSGKLIVAGGTASSTSTTNSAEIYDSAASAWTAAASLAAARYDHTATMLPAGKVLVAGGNSSSGVVSSAELYDPAANAWNAAASPAAGRYVHTATLLPSGKVLVAGGQGNSGFLSSAEVYDPAGNTWSAAGSLGTARSFHTATPLATGKVLAAGGQLNSGALSSVEVYDPASNTWSTAGSLAAARFTHTATLLPSGKVLVAGGQASSGSLNSAEVYDPAANTWSAVGNLSTARFRHTATLLPNGKVLVTGGFSGAAALSSAEVYDPASNTWSAAGSLTTARYVHTATLLPSGKVLVTAGNGNAGYLSSAEVYDPALNTWTAAGSLSTVRGYHTATLLPSGKVFVAAGVNPSYLSSAELTDDGLQYQSAWRPTVTSATSLLQVQTPMSLTGTLFTGISEASGGATNNSPSNNPFIVLQSLANEQVRYLRPDPANPWTATSYTSLPVAPLNPGYALLTVITNGIPSQSSIIQINNPAGVTPVTIADFTARTDGIGVSLEWTAITEFQNAGFNVYRRSTEPRTSVSGWTRVNSTLIAGRVTNADLKTYRLYDWAPPGTYQYKLESVNLDGVCESYAQMAGPVELDWRDMNSRAISDDGVGTAQARIVADAQERRGQEFSAKFAPLPQNATAARKNEQPMLARDAQGSLLKAAAVRAIPYGRAEMPAKGSDAVSRAVTQSVAKFNASVAVRWFSQTPPNRTASYTAVKVVYDLPGVLRIPQSSLPAGFDTHRVSIQREGRSVKALAVTHDALILFGPGYQDDYTDNDAFFLRAIPGNTAAGRASSAAGLFASAQPVSVDSPASVTTSYHDVYYDYNYRPYNFPPWFSGQYLTQGTDQTFSIDTPFANGSAASLVVNVWSLTQSDTITPDHALQVLVNGQPVGQSQWSGGGKMIQLSFEISAGALVTGTNQVDLVTPPLDGVDTQISFLHSMTVNYTRALDASKPVTIVNSSAGTKLFELTSASANAWIVDARYPDRAALVPYESQAQADGTFILRFTAASGGTGQYLVAPMGQENCPLAVTKRQIKPVPSNKQYLAVGPSQFSNGIQSLLTRHSKEGIRALFVDQEQVFDYYGFGRYGPTPIQAAVRSTRPKYLLLIGRTTYDYRNYSGANVDPLCPALLVSTSNWAQTTSDSMFGDLGRGYPEVAVGRLPVNDANELNGAVNHILAYKGIQSSSIKVHAVADRTDPSAGDFGALLDSVSSVHPDMAWQRNYLGMTSYDPADITSAMMTAANGAADLLLYSGHGNALRLGKDAPRILDTDKVQLWTGNTIFLQATCTANWMAKDTADYKSIAIQALTQPQGGISASIGSSTYVTADTHVELMNQLLKFASASGTRWGDALLKTQQWSFQKGTTPGIYSDLGKTEQLFGDPALPVFAPVPSASAGKTTLGKF